ncbi:lipoyl(octanoyl) transferase [Aurantimicrobium minutum]|uniref:lipoyl(octanoyl) transferase LipB n=1 Tax=Aurantimicrobium minutum TaxID=708131 RepID=UPI002473E3AD|nr:lipoyl(octanoyl) transferase LipB [Aurantimicrobium minutum]MDH6278270.1 lipoyl(octanoyl) transferase [Aurantimicrobium minutum]
MLDVVILGLGDDAVPYREAWEKQREIHKQVVSGERPNTLLLLEHQSVYTAGKRTEDSERPVDGTEVIDVDRGGKITWHGPGQLVGYPITKLQEPMDVVAYVRTIEGLLIEAAAEFGVTGERVDGRSGVWVNRGLGYDKVAAIGIRISEGVSMHGFAINCNNSLQAYENIVACGIRDAGATTLSQVSGTNITPSDVVPVVTRLFTHYFEDAHVS